MTTIHTDLVRQLASQLDEYAQRHPHLRPYSALGDSSGEDSILSIAAADMWEELRRIRPDDEFALHHMAIIHHGRAFRDYPNLVATHQQSLPHWRRALECWADLLKHDAFWERLRSVWVERAKSAGDPLAARLLDVPLQVVRNQLPSYLLAPHITIIQDTWSKHPQIARDHLALIRHSQLPSELVRRTMRQIYSLLVGNISSLLDQLDFAKVNESLNHYLAIDPGSPQALADELTAGVKESAKLDGYETKTARFRRSQSHADSLAPFARTSDTVAPEDALTAASALNDYYYAYGLTLRNEGFRIGDSNTNQAFRLISESADMLLRACDFDRTGTHSLSLYVNIVFNLAVLTAEHEIPEDAARNHMNQCRSRSPHSAIGHLVEALLYLKSGNKAGCENVIVAAQRVLDHHPDPYGLECLADVRGRLSNGDPRARRLFSSVLAAMQSGRHAEAGRLIRQVLPMAPPDSEFRLEVLSVWVLCQIQQGDISGARNSLTEAKKLALSYPTSQAAALVNSASNAL